MRKISRKVKKGIPKYIKGQTLEKKASLFFKSVQIVNCSEWDLLLVCAGMKICSMRLPVYMQNISEVNYALIIADLLQAELEPFGVKVGRPVPNELGGYTYLVCR